MNSNNPHRISLALLSTNQRVTVTISEILRNDHDKVDQRPNSAAAQSQQLGHADAGFLGVKAVYTQAP